MRSPFRSSFLVAGLVLAGCSSGSGGGEAEVTLLLTDAASDELAVFEVDVTGVELRRADGSAVATLDQPVRVDFAQLAELSELITGRVIPAGFYSGATLTLDFANAVVYLQGQTTNASVVDAAGAPLTGTVDVAVTFATGSRPHLVARRNHLWTLDLDLNQSLAVDAGANRVTFTPAVTAVVDPTHPKPVRAQGALGTVDLDGRTFLVQTLTRDGTVLAPYTVRTTTTTLFQIDGVVSFGDAGLGALALRAGAAPRVFVQGTVEQSSRVLVAAAVETGAGVPGNGQDWILGHIVARDGAAGGDATLTVVGQSFDTGTGTRRFHTGHAVQVSRADTKVLQRGFGSLHGTDDLNVGQRVMVFGDLAGTTMDATAQHEGVVRMLPTAVFGFVTDVSGTTTLVLEVTRFDQHPVAEFDFTVGGVAEADPDAYRVDVTEIDLEGIEVGARVRAVGFVKPVGVPLDDDFRALTVVDHANSASVLVCQWSPDVAVVPTAGGSAVAFDVSQASVKAVADGFMTRVLQNEPTPVLTPLGNRGAYSIVSGSSAEVHAFFTTFSAALLARTGAGARMVRIAAVGTFDPELQELAAAAASVVLQ